MKYIQLQRSSQSIITIREYIKEKQPKIFIMLLKSNKKRAKIDVTNSILDAADITGKNKYYRSIMQERPKGGRGGLLRGEKEEELW